MKSSQKTPSRWRPYISTALFFMLALLAVTGILLKIFIAMDAGVPKAFCLALHALTGFFVFTYLSILHLIANWKSLKSYIPSLWNRTFRWRHLASVGLLITLLMLVASAILININEAVENDVLIHRYTVVHTLSGVIFVLLSIYHIIVNWAALKSYVPIVRSMSKRQTAMVAFLVALGPLIIGILLALFYS